MRRFGGFNNLPILGLADVKSTWPRYAGPHMCHNGKNSGMLWSDLKQYLKNYRSSNCALQFVHIKAESLVIAYKNDAVNVKSSFAHTAHHAQRGVSAACNRSF